MNCAKEETEVKQIEYYIYTGIRYEADCDTSPGKYVRVCQEILVLMSEAQSYPGQKSRITIGEQNMFGGLQLYC
jgi:hypothetical protein